jgi:hypothetical protein
MGTSVHPQEIYSITVTLQNNSIARVKNEIFLFTIILHSLILYIPISEAQNTQNFSTKEGYLPNKETATAVAKIVLSKIYGAEQIRKQLPFSAKLIGEVWHISGTLDKDKVGGVANIEIRKDGKIVHVSHSR